MEKRVLDDATCVVAVSPLVQQEFQAMTQTPVELITNGFDECDFHEEPFAMAAGGPSMPFTITHTGLFAADGNPTVLWDVLAEKCASCPEFKKSLRINLIGKTDEQIIKAIEAAGLGENLHDMGYQSHARATEEQRKASLLILPLRKEPEYKAVLPGKLFEYLASWRPVLGIGQPDGAMSMILNNVSFKKIKIKYFIINDEFYFFPQLKVNEVVKKIIKLGYSDIEYFSGIPGTIGGLLAMNASCFEKEISDYLIEAFVACEEGVKWLKKEELDFKYRSSRIKEENMVLLFAKMRFPKTNNKKEVYENLVKLLKIRNDKQPVNYKSAGCAFKNLCDKKAWEIIKELGYSGKKIGGAKVSEKHCNFIVNDNNASANDVHQLMRMIKEEAYSKNVILENEWILINFD